MYNITFQQIAMFMEVAQRLNISAVANEAYISQAALSKMIHRLEESLGITLFNRSNRGLSLTEEGEYIYSHLKYSFNSVCLTLQHAQMMKKQTKTQVRIGYPSTFDSTADYDKLKEFINNYKKKHPEIEFVESLYDFVDLMHSVLYAQVDVAFIHSFILNDAENSGISSKPVVNCKTFIAMSVNNPLSAETSLTREMLDNEVFYALPMSPSNSESSVLRNIADNYGYEPRQLCLVPNFASWLRMLNSGKGVAISGNFSQLTKDEIKYYDFPNRQLTHTLNVTWRSDNTSPIIRDFLKSFPSDPKLLTCF